MEISQGDGFDLGLDAAFEVLATRCCAYFYFGVELCFCFPFEPKTDKLTSLFLTQINGCLSDQALLSKEW